MIKYLKNYSVYQFYRDLQAKLLSSGLDLDVEQEIMNFLKANIATYRKLPISEIIDSTKISPSELDKFLLFKFMPLFKGERKLDFHRAVVSKQIMSNIFTNSVATIDGENVVVLKSYQNNDDLFELLHQVMRIFSLSEDYCNREIIARAYSLILADFLDKEYNTEKYYKSTISTQVASLTYNMELAKLYPNIIPCLYGYIKADFLANEFYLLYRENQEEFVNDVNALFNFDVTVDEIIQNRLILADKTKIVENHKKILIPNK